MVKSLLILFIFTTLRTAVVAQKITISDAEIAERQGAAFDIVGKVKNNIAIYQVRKWQHSLSIFDNDMKLIRKDKLDFLPSETFSVDFIPYPTHIYMVYQYQKRSMLFCMIAKLNEMGEVIEAPKTLDSLKLPVFADNKIFNIGFSENKEKIALYKLPKRADDYTFAVKIFDKDLQQISNYSQKIDKDERRDTYDNFMVDNAGNFIFTKEEHDGNRSTSNNVEIQQIQPGAKSVTIYKVDLQENFVENIHLKIDNLNQKYLLNTLYYPKSRGNIGGLITVVADAKSTTSKTEIAFFEDDIRAQAKEGRQYRSALDNYFIQQVISKKDGGFFLMAEDYAVEQNNNMWNRYGYNNFSDPWGNYYYNNSYDFYGRRNSFANNLPTRYMTDNIMLVSVNKTGKIDWVKFVPKTQNDENELMLSFGVIPFSGELHFIYNMDANYSVLSNHAVAPDGKVTRYPTLKTEDKGYFYMPRYSKNISARTVLMPALYRGYVCFAKVEF